MDVHDELEGLATAAQNRLDLISRAAAFADRPYPEPDHYGSSENYSRSLYLMDALERLKEFSAGKTVCPKGYLTADTIERDLCAWGG